jgi:hypothetical protein
MLAKELKPISNFLHFFEFEGKTHKDINPAKRLGKKGNHQLNA